MHTAAARVLFTMTLLFRASTSAADSIAPPSTYLVESADQQFVFVMVPPLSLEQELRFLSEDFGEKTRKIREAHPVSGLYRNDGTSEPLWTVDWYASGAEIYSDGVHLVRHGPWAQRLSDEAISFFANGKLLRSYRVSDLIKDRSRLERTVSHFFWQEDVRLDDRALRYTVATVDRRCYVFDVTTGAIVSVTSPCKPASSSAADERNWREH